MGKCSKPCFFKLRKHTVQVSGSKVTICYIRYTVNISTKTTYLINRFIFTSTDSSRCCPDVGVIVLINSLLSWYVHVNVTLLGDAIT